MRHPQEMETLEFQDISELICSFSFPFQFYKKRRRGVPYGRGHPWPRPEAHLPAGMTEGGGAVKPSQWHYEHSEIFLMLPGGLA